MSDRFYVKKNGKYVPSSDPRALDGLTDGAWIVIVNGGSKSCRRKLSPEHADINGALEYLHAGLCKAMHEAGKIKPTSILMSEKEQKAWKAYDKIIGKDKPSSFCFASYSNIADAACDYVGKILLENNCNVGKIKEKYKIKKEILTALDRLEV